jgi:hypothetical protein
MYIVSLAGEENINEAMNRKLSFHKQESMVLVLFCPMSKSVVADFVGFGTRLQ